jgi:hypothetical protein
MPAGQINNRQAAMSKPNTRLGMDTAIIRPPMELGLIHALQQTLINRAPLTGVKYSSDSAHGLPCEILAPLLRIQLHCV